MLLAILVLMLPMLGILLFPFLFPSLLVLVLVLVLEAPLLYYHHRCHRQRQDPPDLRTVSPRLVASPRLQDPGQLPLPLPPLLPRPPRRWPPKPAWPLLRADYLLPHLPPRSVPPLPRLRSRRIPRQPRPPPRAPVLRQGPGILAVQRHTPLLAVRCLQRQLRQRLRPRRGMRQRPRCLTLNHQFFLSGGPTQFRCRHGSHASSAT